MQKASTWKSIALLALVIGVGAWMWSTMRPPESSSAPEALDSQEGSATLEDPVEPAEALERVKVDATVSRTLTVKVVGESLVGEIRRFAVLEGRSSCDDHSRVSLRCEGRSFRRLRLRRARRDPDPAGQVCSLGAASRRQRAGAEGSSHPNLGATQRGPHRAGNPRLSRKHSDRDDREPGSVRGKRGASSLSAATGGAATVPPCGDSSGPWAARLAIRGCSFGRDPRSCAWRRDLGSPPLRRVHHTRGESG
jgi:hypothetical protein